MNSWLVARDESSVLKGHELTRAVNAAASTRALAPAGRVSRNPRFHYRLLILAWTLLVISTGRCFAGEQLVYAVRHPGSGRTDNTWTEVFSVGTGTSAPVRLFSDATLALKLDGPIPIEKVSGTMQRQHFLLAAVRLRGAPYSQSESIYAISLDGSGTYRKLIDPVPGTRVDSLFVSSSGDRFGYLSLIPENWTLYLYDRASGRLVRSVELSKSLNGCEIDHVGWLGDDQTLYLYVSQRSGFPDSDDPCVKQVGGVWTLREDGSGQTHLSAQQTAPLLAEGYQILPFEPARLLGQLATGEFAFVYRIRAKSAKAQYAIAVAGQPPAGFPAIYVGNDARMEGQYSLSPSGKMLAYIAGTIYTSPNTKRRETIVIRSLASDKADSETQLPVEPSGTSVDLLGWIE